jgi:hypothetical protein
VVRGNAFHHCLPARPAEAKAVPADLSGQALYFLLPIGSRKVPAILDPSPSGASAALTLKATGVPSRWAAARQSGSASSRQAAEPPDTHCAEDFTPVRGRPGSRIGDV